MTLPQWEPGLVFEVKARRLKLLRMKAQRGDSDKTRLHAEMESLLSGLSPSTRPVRPYYADNREGTDNGKRLLPWGWG
ncbi:hypothetical protein A9312_15290 [Yersinia pestis]|nr:hypothetical protein AU390_14920 [Yersinia pestis]PCN68303.1 hypothetical protein A8V19_17035 [Yersinia pestis]PVF33176.1 hypothetical protein A9312_15290 [Yersinia pestis]